jgi:hypothetical protein
MAWQFFQQHKTKRRESPNQSTEKEFDMAIDTPSTETAAAPDAAAHKPHTAHKVSLEHFATRLSGTDKRVALIHGFVHTMKAAKKFRDFPANYHAAFADYTHTPFSQRSAANTATAENTK